MVARSSRVFQNWLRTLKQWLEALADMHQSALCDLGLRTCKMCRALRRSQREPEARRST